jgi:DNA-directed RNA polymerase III subunit RPC7
MLTTGVNPYQKYDVPKAERLLPREQAEVDRYRALRERFHDGPYYTVLEAARTSAKKGSAARALFDAFHGMQSYSEKYIKKKRVLPKLQGRPYGECCIRPLTTYL